MLQRTKISQLFLRIIVLYFFLCTVLFCSAQTAGVQKRIFLQNSNRAYSRDVIETTPGNFILIGQSYDSLAGQLENHLTLVGIDNNGNLTWRKTYGSNKFTYSALVGSSRYIIKHSGFLYSAMPATDSNSRIPGVFIKFNFLGDTIWQKKFYQANPAAYNYFTSVCPSVDGGFFITGAVQTNTPSYNGHPTTRIYLLKTDFKGNKLWDKTLYKSNLDETQSGFDISQDSVSKKIVIVGYQDRSTGGTATVLILDSVGNLLIQKGQFTGPQYFGSGLMHLIRSKDGNFIASGGVNYPFVNLDPTYRSFLVKFDIDANIIFSQEYDTVSYDNNMSRLVELNDGSLITGGDLDVLHKYSNGTNNILRVMKLDKNGNFVWKKYFDNYTDGGNSDFLTGLVLSDNGQIAFTSFCECPEPAPIQFIFYRTDTSYCDANAVACYSEITVGVQEHDKNTSQFILYPNPARDWCTLRQRSNTIERITLYNLLGELIYEKTGDGLLQYVIDLKSFESGVYYIKVISDGKEYPKQKLIIIR